MTGPDILDDTTGDYERLEAELVAQNREATRVATADADGMTVHRLVGALVADDVVTPAPTNVFSFTPAGCSLELLDLKLPTLTKSVIGDVRDSSIRLAQDSSAFTRRRISKGTLESDH